ncbi:MAG: radical SAM protein [Candidatus Thorarchaeota archaeon]
MFSGLHLLLTYKCNFECDHCFVYSHPHAKGVMRISDVREILNEAERLGTVKWIYFEGGEPFLYYQTMLWGLREAKRREFRTGIVTNSYWATSVEDAREWLRPVSEIGIDDLSISDDSFHYSETDENLAKYAHEASIELGIPVGTITIEDPQKDLKEIKWKGKPVTAGSVQFKGRAVEKLTDGLPRKPWKEFDDCPDEDFTNPGRVHIDPFGYVHLCQGIALGNMKKTPLRDLITGYNPNMHPICAPLLQGGPAELVKKYDVKHEEDYIDACHLCYSARLKLRDRFPEILVPDGVYGV